MQAQIKLPEPRLTPVEKCEPIGCQVCCRVVGWTDGEEGHLEWKGEPICEDCYAEKVADLPLPEFLEEIDKLMSYDRKITFKVDMILIQYDTIRSEIQDAVKLLEIRGLRESVNYTVSHNGNLLTFAIIPTNGGKLDLI